MKYLVTIYYLAHIVDKHNKIVRRWKKFHAEPIDSKKYALIWVKSFTRIKDRKVSITRR